jgi:hypothetical protein
VGKDDDKRDWAGGDPDDSLNGVDPREPGSVSTGPAPGGHYVLLSDNTKFENPFVRSSGLHDYAYCGVEFTPRGMAGHTRVGLSLPLPAFTQEDVFTPPEQAGKLTSLFFRVVGLGADDKGAEAEPADDEPAAAAAAPPIVTVDTSTAPPSVVFKGSTL